MVAKRGCPACEKCDTDGPCGSTGFAFRPIVLYIRPRLVSLSPFLPPAARFSGIGADIKSEECPVQGGGCVPPGWQALASASRQDLRRI